MCAKRRIKQIKKTLAQLALANRQWEELLNEPITASFRQRLKDLIAKDRRITRQLRQELQKLESEIKPSDK
ncbi:MAG: hypothetical protein WC668_02925 [Patescibacteria group bacterium]|jgi:hypothetical protein